MTTQHRRERALPSILADLAAGPRPDYIDDVLAATGQRRQRPAWTFPERWPFMADLAERRALIPPPPWRLLAVALLILALIGGAVAVYVGSQRTRVPAPFGPAANGIIAFSVGGDTWTLDAATGIRTLLAGDANDDDGTAFSPDGTRLAILSIGPDGGNRIRITDLDGTPPVYLAPDPFVQLHGWEWSPDGRMIAAIHMVDGSRSLSLVPTDGGPVRTMDLGDLTPMAATWRPPDGRDLLVSGERNGQIGLYLVAQDGSNLRAVRGPEPAAGPVEGWPDPNVTHLGGATWSPDGGRIAYVAVETVAGGAAIARVHVMNADGSGDRELAAPDGVSDTWPAWSPDGRRLLTARIGGGETWPAILGLEGATLDVDRRQPLATGSITVAGWSPDGRLVHLVERDAVTLVDADSGSPVGAGWANVPWPGWQRLAP